MHHHLKPVSVSSSPASARVTKVANETKRLEWKPPSEYHSAPERWVTMRSSHQRLQLSAESLLDCLTDVTNGKNVASERPFCVVGITNQDLFTEKNNLFIAGLMAGRSHVAVLSFLRYHPHVKMSPAQHWWEYGYSSKQSSYSYLNQIQSLNLWAPRQNHSVSANARYNYSITFQIPQSAASKRELLRRASKLRVHEILHVYQVDHCIYYKCLMHGTGHLVEDFASPAHLCGIDLRKLQYRCGFDVATSSWYRELAKVYESWKCTREARWYHQREKEATTIISAEKDNGGGG